MLQHQTTLEVETHGQGFTDLSARVAAIVTASGVSTGLCVVFVRHTSASLLIQENADPAVLADLQRFAAELAPESKRWEHAEEGPDDMPAHVRSAVTRSSETIPVSGGRLVLGTWQALYLWEHRRASHRRSVVVHVLGAGAGQG